MRNKKNPRAGKLSGILNDIEQLTTTDRRNLAIMLGLVAFMAFVMIWGTR